ncbi:MAG: phosphoenolpyruvate hydrolase family protein [Hyphomicrobiaceae bacterium]|nr:phosphoenolpyruvate hydrolase family protein [Hyphomicrobiaceae bacterium]
MTAPPRAEILKRFRQMIAAGDCIIGAGAGIGLSAKCEEAGGADLIIIYNSGRYRMAGRSSSAGLLAYGNANQILIDMAYEILPVVQGTPVIAGVNATDPFIIWEAFLHDLKRLGFAGIQNYPTVGRVDGELRTSLEQTGITYAREVEVMAMAHAMDFLTTPYVFSAADARAMAEAGADLLVCHLGLTSGGMTGARSTRTLEECAMLIDEWARAALAVRDDVIILCHGGPIATPEDVSQVLRSSRLCHGFYGASSMERLPIEKAITEHIRRFKSIRREP